MIARFPGHALASLVLGSVVLSHSVFAESQPVEKPNFIVFLVDDKYDTTRC